jgi:hypothetical protein
MAARGSKTRCRRQTGQTGSTLETWRAINAYQLFSRVDPVRPPRNTDSKTIFAPPGRGGGGRCCFGAPFNAAAGAGSPFPGIPVGPLRSISNKTIAIFRG